MYAFIQDNLSFDFKEAMAKCFKSHADASLKKMINMENINWKLDERPSVFLQKMLESINKDPDETKNNRDGLAVTIGKVVALESMSDIYK